MHLTKQEVKEAVQEAIQKHATCHTFTPDEVVMIKRRLRTIDKVANVIGYAVIGAILAGFAALAALGGWFKIGGK